MSNTVILKPVEQSSLTALELGELALEVDILPCVLNVIPGFSTGDGKALVLHNNIDIIAFTYFDPVSKTPDAVSGTEQPLKRRSAWNSTASPHTSFSLTVSYLDYVATKVAWAFSIIHGRHAPPDLVSWCRTR